MDKAFVITGFMREESRHIPVTGVLFCPTAPDCKALKNMGFIRPTMEEVNISGMSPNVPTLFYFKKMPCPTEVTMAQVDPDGHLGKTAIREGDPMALIPAIFGAAVERHVVQRGSLRPDDLAPKLASTAPPQSKRPIKASG